MKEYKPLLRGMFGAADTDTKFTRGLAACALTAVHVALSGRCLHLSTCQLNLSRVWPCLSLKTCI